MTARSSRYQADPVATLIVKARIEALRLRAVNMQMEWPDSGTHMVPDVIYYQKILDDTRIKHPARTLRAISLRVAQLADLQTVWAPDLGDLAELESETSEWEKLIATARERDSWAGGSSGAQLAVPVSGRRSRAPSKTPSQRSRGAFSGFTDAPSY